jgi:glycosyltransferase involved in cell wall biosynthesis
MWKDVEKLAVPAFRVGYTVNEWIAEEFRKMYGVDYEVIRNLPVLEIGRAPEAEGRQWSDGGAGEPVVSGGETVDIPGVTAGERFVLYQGAVNEGRGFDALIPAMQTVGAKLVICGNGNYMEQARALVRQYALEDKVLFMGKVLPEPLKAITRSAWCGITLFDRQGISNYYSLANRFFDYIQAGIPQVAVDYPAYAQINNLYHIAVLVKEPGIRAVADALGELLNNTGLYHTLMENCKQARLRYNWQEEEKKLIRFYQKIFS